MIDFVGHIIGRYQVLEYIGHGGMSDVYKAIDLENGNEIVAIKILRNNFSFAVQDSILRRFENEASLMAELNHPNIIKVTDHGTYEGYPYLVMPYLSGGTLKERTGNPIAWEEVLRLIIPIARALSYAHKKSSVHRDIKPENILLTDDNVPVLTDFGIAKIREEGERQSQSGGTQAGLGTVGYMAPEHWSNKNVDGRVDVYALGVVLFQMLTGRLPYPGETAVEVALRQAKDPLPRPSLFNPKIPIYVDKVVMKAMAKEAKGRYQTMDDLVVALQSLLDNTGPDKTHGWKKLGFAGIIVLGLGILALTQANPPAPGPLPTQTPTKLLSSPLPEKTKTITPIMLSATYTVTFLPTATPTVTLQPTEPSTATLLPTTTPTSAALPIKQHKIVFYSLRNNNYEIYIMNEDGTDQTNLTNTPTEAGEFMAAVSPDGNFIAYARDNTPADGILDYEIYVMNIDGSNAHPITAVGGYNAEPFWSPDGTQIAFTSNRDGNKDIWIMNSDGSQPEKITKLTQDELLPAWSPDGLYIAYQTTFGFDDEIYIRRLDEKDPINISNNPDTDDVNPSWSPDSQRILFTSARMGYLHEIFEMDINGTSLRQITNNRVSDMEPKWSPDGDWIVYSSKIGDQYEICKMRADGSDYKQLTTNSAHDRVPVWLPTGY